MANVSTSKWLGGLAVAGLAAMIAIVVSVGLGAQNSEGRDAPAATPKATKGAMSKGGPGGRFRAATLVELAPVTREPLVRLFPITGRLVASQRSDIPSKIAGSVASVYVQVGDRVERGQLLAELDVNRLRLEARLKAAGEAQAQAKLKSAEAQVKLLRMELNRIERLQKSAAFSQARFEDLRQEVVKAETTVDEASAALKYARAATELAEIDLTDAEVRAPFAGVVLVRHISPGTYVGTGARIVTLLDDRNLEIEADIPAVRLDGLIQGATVAVRIDPDTRITAKLRAIVPDENPMSRTRAVRFVPNFGEHAQIFAANQSVVVEVPGGNREVTAIPKDAVVNQQGGRAVFIYEAGRVRAVEVELGDAFADKFEVVSGLEPGTEVVVRGNELLSDGDAVRLADRSGDPTANREN